jgi:ABC-type multidrug transport system ATPase subunit
MTELIVKTRRLSYSFQSGVKVLKDINLEIPQGSVYGFLGPNGSGKTTTLRLLLGLLRARNSSINIFGTDLILDRVNILRRIGSLIEQPSLYLHLTGFENLGIYRLSFDIPQGRIIEVLNIVGLADAAGKKTKAYSLGMKQRLGIAIALLHDPELLILDEPTNGLDPTGIQEMRELIRKLNQEYGKTILISSHLLTEIEKIASHVGIIHRGELLFQGALEVLQQLKSHQSHIELRVNDPKKALSLLPTGVNPTLSGELIRMGYVSDKEFAGINKMLVLNEIEVYDFGHIKHELEDIFMTMITD